MTVEIIEADGDELEIEHAEGGVRFLVNGAEADPASNEAIRRTLEIGVLCNTVPVDYDGEDVTAGDPMETALVAAGREAGIEKQALLERFPETKLFAFDSAVNMMATVHGADGGYRTAVKGAPDSVLRASAFVLTPDGEREFTGEQREAWKKKNDELAAKGYRVIAHAEKNTDGEPDKPYEGLTFLGLVGLLDPPRPDVKDAIEKCIEAGIKVVMVTGDHPSTAKNIALAVGLVDDRNVRPLHGSVIKKVEGLSDEDTEVVSDSLILARVSPEQKLELVKMKQESGLVVAMTGDGVNDAPALRQADIGIAMGLRGTQVAREAADIVLKDDSFGTIVSAVEQGRIIYGNIKKFIFYLISCNVSEIMIVAFASFALIPLPILPLQILFLNLVTDIFPALALGMGEGDEHIMKEPPRDPKEPLLSRRRWLGIAGYGAVITLSVLGALLYAIHGLGYGSEQAVSVSFLTLAFAQLFHVFNMRDKGSAFVNNEITRNPYIWGALGLCSLLIAAAVYIKPLAEVLRIIPPGIEGWTLIAVMSLAPLAIGQILKVFR
ncbi:MAG: cation-transporting P-type ATPase [Thermodesulfobacteriota bacterium]